MDAADALGSTSKKRKLDTEATDAEDEARRKAEKKERKRLKKLAKEQETEVVMLNGDSERKEKKKKKSKKHSVVDDSTPATTIVAPTPAGSTTPTPATTFFADHRITVHDGEITPATTFDELNISPKLRSQLNKFTKPTPIQACTWPVLLQGKDVVGIAETGSGKTMAFSLPAVARLLAEPKPKKKGSAVSILVLSPTRELAIQSHETLKELAEPFGFTSVCIYGGASKHGQRDALKGSATSTVRILVATPGRMLDFLDEGTISLSNVSYLVLDEADRMLDSGFENDIRNIISQTMQGEERQTLMFSATWPESVRRLASTFQRHPVRVTIGSEELSANVRVEQVVEVMEERQKEARLTNLLKSLNLPNSKTGSTSRAASTENKVLVFCLYKKEAARVEANLKWQGYSVAAIHGDLNQNAREQALSDFKTGKAGLMVATDVAARGLDIPNVSLVINYTFPLTTEDYVHRIGRTGRAGKTGKSVTFFTGEGHERALAGELMRVLRDAGFSCDALQKFPMTVKKKEHGSYGAFYKDIGNAPTSGTKIKF